VYARSTTVYARPELMEAGIANVRDEIYPAVIQMPGCVGMSMLVDRDSGRGVVTAAWDSASALRASAASVEPMRQRSRELVGSDRPAEVQEWEIAVMHRAHAAHEGACARITWMRMDPADIDRGVDFFKLAVLPKLEESQGFCSASLLVDPESGRAASTVTFDSRATMEATRDQAETLRTTAARELGGEITDVGEFELVFAHLHVPEMA
jgi:quinol monooxygenase YgiN